MWERPLCGLSTSSGGSPRVVPRALLSGGIGADTLATYYVPRRPATYSLAYGPDPELVLKRRKYGKERRRVR